jgi:heme exporter protein A
MCQQKLQSDSETQAEITPMLTVSQLSLERYFQPVFQPVDFSLQAGELMMITGANGSGKTTLIRLLAGILTASSGSINNTAASTAYLGHALAIKEDLSALENLRFVIEFNGGSATAIEQALKQAGLSHVAHQPARTLSAGQRKRCALARLLLVPAQLWLLDEPYSNLDQDGIGLVDQLLIQHVQGGGAAIVATHGEHRPKLERQQDLSLLAGSVH